MGFNPQLGLFFFSCFSIFSRLHETPLPCYFNYVAIASSIPRGISYALSPTLCEHKVIDPPEVRVTSGQNVCTDRDHFHRIANLKTNFEDPVHVKHLQD